MKYGPPASAAEWKALSAALGTAFAVDGKGVRRWIAKAGRGNFRVLRDGRTVVAGLNVIPMGQWFGGRRVSMTGIAGVAVPPEHRARGNGSALMAAAVREIAAGGTALSGLYPATQPIYRRVGYEEAGTRTVWRTPVAAVDVRDREGSVREAGPRDRPAIRRLYGDLARSSAGVLDRSPYMWWRVLGRSDGAVRTFVVERAGRVEGYAVLQQEKRATMPPYDLWLQDYAVSTPGAGRTLLSFLAAHRSLAGDLHWAGGPSDALLALFGDPDVQVKRTMRWMLRITDLRRAVAERGFPGGLEAEVHLEVEDPLVAKNAGRWILAVGNGLGRLARGGRGSVKTTVSALAPIYSGFRSPSEQRALGGIEGPAGDLNQMGAAFAGPPPWNREMY